MKDRLKTLRENRQLTQKDFGAKIGVSDKVVSKWERGTSEPDIGTLKKISETYRVGIEELIGSPRRENVAFPARKVEKGFLYYSVFVVATMIFVAATIAFCALYAKTLNGKIAHVRPVGDLTVGFVPVVFGVILLCVFTTCSQIKFRAFPLFTKNFTGGKTLNEFLRLPSSIRKVYSVFGNWLAFYYFVFQVWNSLNVAAYLFKASVVLRYSSHLACVVCLAVVTLSAGFALKRVAKKDEEAAALFEEIRD